MVVDGKRLSEGERLKFLAGMEDEGKRTPVQLELPMDYPPVKPPDDEYFWKQYQRESQEEEKDPHRLIAGILVVLFCSVVLLALLALWAMR